MTDQEDRAGLAATGDFVEAPLPGKLRAHAVAGCGDDVLPDRNGRRAAIVRICDRPALREMAAGWFHEKWGIPQEAYLESMDACVEGRGPVPQWYAALEDERMIAGLGVIENDFHDRKDLAPNVCAVYVEKDFRGRGIAGELLRFACADMKGRGVETLYLLTDHCGFYEKYGWEFLCMAQGDGEADMSRMYVHRSR